MIANNVHMGWQQCRPKGYHSRLKMYEGRDVVIVSGGKSKYRRLYLTDTAVRILKNAPFARLYQRGTNIAIFPGQSPQDGSYRVTQDKNATFFSIACGYWLREWGLKPGAYDFKLEQDGIMFDTSQLPASI